MTETHIIEGNRNSTRNQVYAFDLQKVLHTNFGENDLLYYYSKMAVHNRTSFDHLTL